SDFLRRLGHLSVALITRHLWITAGLRARFGRDATASALGTRVCGTSCRLVPSLVRKWHPELKLSLSVLKMGQSHQRRGNTHTRRAKREAHSRCARRSVVSNDGPDGGASRHARGPG